MQKRSSSPSISRRSFLKGAAGSAAGLAALGLLGAQAQAEAASEAPSPAAAAKYEVINTDLIIVGAGWGAISAAFQAISLGKRVAIIEKAPYRHGGAAGYNWDLYIPFMKNREALIAGAKASTDRSRNNKAYIKCYESDPYFDIPTTQLNRGEILPRRNADGTQDWYVNLESLGYVEGAYARSGQDVLASSPLVSIYDRTMVTNLLVNHGRCLGVVGLYLPTGDVRVFRAPATITATGATTAFIGWTGVCAHSINGMDNTGDVDMAAYRLGAGIGHSESSGQDFCSTYPSGLGYGWSCIVNPDSLEPDTYADKDGKHIFDKEKDAEVIAMGAVDRSVFNAHVARILNEGTRTTEEGGLLANLENARLRRFVQHNLLLFEKFGIDPTKEMLPIHDEQYERGGQPVIDENLMSEDIQGLFCVRGAGVSGVSKGGVIATDNIPFGGYAARCAVAYMDSAAPAEEIDFSPADEEFSRLHQIRTRDAADGVRPFAVRHQIQNACGNCCGLLRRKEDLEAALAELSSIREEMLPRMVLADKSQTFNTEWKEAIENYNLLDAAQLMVKASLLREESVHGTYFRPDFPQADPENWNCMLVGRWSEEGPQFEKKEFSL